MQSDILVKIAIYLIPVIWACAVSSRALRPIKTGFFHGLSLWVFAVFLLYSFLPQLITIKTLYYAAYCCITGTVFAAASAAWRATRPQEPPQ